MTYFCVAICFNLSDFLSGFIAALKNHDVKSQKMRDGLFKKIGLIMCMALAIGVDRAQLYIDLKLPFDTIVPVATWVVITEIISIIENIGKINPDILPDTLKKLFGLDNEDK